MIENIHQIETIQQIGNLRETQQGEERAQVNRAISLPQDKVTLSYQAEGKQKNNAGSGDEELSPDQQRQVTELKRRDAEVKAHERAHTAAGGGLVRGGASYQYQRGPDGRSYAVGGEVSIDVSPERTPEATIRKMQQVKAAALAPAQPSGTDRAVAARATQMETQARAEKNAASESEDKNGAVEDAGSAPSAQAHEPSAASLSQESASTDKISRSENDGAYTYQRFGSGNRGSSTHAKHTIGNNISISA